MPDIRLAARRSPLALAQARIAAEALAERGYTTQIVPVVTTGDRDRTSPVAALTEVGAFVRAVQTAVLDGEADVAVHSAKDLPVAGPADLLGFHLERGSPWDVMCGASPSQLGAGSTVGTGSPRRSAQLTLIAPQIEVSEIRGNVETRLEAIAGGRVDAVVLAAAGLERLGLEGRITYRFELDEMVPAPAQGAIALEVRSDAYGLVELLEDVEDVDTGTAVEAERRLLALAGAGCRSALGAFAWIGSGGSVNCRGFVEDEAGARTAQVTGDGPDQVADKLRTELQL